LKILCFSNNLIKFNYKNLKETKKGTISDCRLYGYRFCKIKNEEVFYNLNINGKFEEYKCTKKEFWNKTKKIKNKLAIKRQSIYL
jgi:hypothetical protein